MQGLLNRLHDQHDALSKKLLRDAVFYVIPNMNPDGTWRGHLRTNAAGANLNREWAHPTAEQSPEVGLGCTEAEGFGLMCQGRLSCREHRSELWLVTLLKLSAAGLLYVASHGEVWL